MSRPAPIARARLAARVLTLAGAILGAPAAHAQGFTFTTIDVPDAFQTEALGINDAGQVVGTYYCGIGSPTCTGVYGFVFADGVFTSIDLPGGLRGINAAGQIVGAIGTASGGSRGFVYDAGSLTFIDAPGASSTTLFGINAAGQIIGRSSVGPFLYDRGTFTPFTVPGGFSATPWGINDAGQVVGWYYDGERTRGFVSGAGTFTSIDVPVAGAVSTQAFGINARGQVVGLYLGADGRNRSFIYDTGAFTFFDRPGTTSTFVSGINAAGQIVGSYANERGRPSGFLATPATVIPEPGPLALLAAGVGVLGGVARRRRARSAARPGC
jgi:uncharacterized membrane protein